MKKLLLIIAALIFSCSFLQAQDSVEWEFTAKKIDSKTYEIHLTAVLEGMWHLYSQKTPVGGPAATEISFSKNPLLIFDGEVKEIGNLEEHFEPLFGVKVKQYSDKVSFVQVVKLKVKAKTKILGTVNFMTCNDVQCMPTKKQAFSITLN